MTVLLNFIQKIVNTIQSVMVFIVSIPGMILTAVGSFFAFLSDALNLGKFFGPLVDMINRCAEFVNRIVSWVDSAHDTVAGASGLADYVRYVVAVDSLVSDLISVIGLTFGVLVYVMFSFLFAILAILASLFVVRGVQKVISVFSAGYVKT